VLGGERVLASVHSRTATKVVFSVVSLPGWLWLSCGPMNPALLLTCLVLLVAPARAAELPPMLNLPGTGGDAAKIDFAKLPVLKGAHAVVCPYE